MNQVGRALLPVCEWIPPTEYFIAPDPEDGQECPSYRCCIDEMGVINMDWQVILIIIGFCVGAWLLGKLMTDSGRNMDDGGGGG